MSKEVQVSVMLISGREFGTQITQEEFDRLEVDMHNAGAIRIGNLMVQVDRIECIWIEE